MEKRTFYAPDIDIARLAQALNDWFAGQGYQTQFFPSANGGATVQARKESTLRTLTGMATALTAVLNLEGENIAVEMGGAKWIDKGVAAGVGALIFWPALVTAGVGAYQQNQLQTQAWQFIDQYVKSNSAYAAGAAPGAGMGAMGMRPPMGPGMMPPMPGQPMGPPPMNMGATGMAGANGATANCSQCGQPLRQGAKFCDNCGAPTASTCRSCGKPLRPGARFCDECGAPVN